jgi:protein-L-isoaspartate(D-aspartate) O-methyltransferase
MVREQIEARGIRDPAVLSALRAVPRHLFVSGEYRRRAYEDSPLPIGYGQTISQPYIVARMSELLQLPRDRSDTRVLEIGMGCGYQTAVLARLAGTVFSMEIVPELCAEAARLLANAPNVHIRCGDGYGGWQEEAPFDGILVAAAPARIPPPLLDQLGIGGRMVIPVGDDRQKLLVVQRTSHGYQNREILPVRFVPMTGRTERADGK